MSKFKICSMLFLIYFFSCSPCIETDIGIIENLKGNKNIIAFMEDCGATTDYSSHIYFFEKDPYNRKEKVFMVYHSGGLYIKKNSSDTISVTFSGTDVFYMKEKVNDIIFIFKNNPTKIPKFGITIEQ
jgi:hypothetical protein